MPPWVEGHIEFGSHVKMEIVHAVVVDQNSHRIVAVVFRYLHSGPSVVPRAQAQSLRQSHYFRRCQNHLELLVEFLAFLNVEKRRSDPHHLVPGIENQSDDGSRHVRIPRFVMISDPSYRAHFLYEVCDTGPVSVEGLAEDWL